jgi:phosphoribosylglycinamide formyltransferase-1|tara:strand:- start:295 stop:876 length:582 start_codon:yes stop_codon:yes gene_type:complete
MGEVKKISIAILASGTGSNAQALVKHFEAIQEIDIVYIGSNNSSAGVLEIASSAGISSSCFSKSDLQTGVVLEELKTRCVDYVFLCGFLLKIPANLIAAFEGRILNIHPALLPKFGGKGMYGLNVHGAVLESGDQSSGMTIHKVSAEYDEGDIVFQCSSDISKCKTAEEIANVVLALEHEYYPRIAEAFIKNS